MGDSFSAQAQSLTRAGLPTHLLLKLCESLLKRTRRSKPLEEQEGKEKRKVAVIRYVHGVSHPLKKVAARAGVTVVFSAPNKLSGFAA